MKEAYIGVSCVITIIAMLLIFSSHNRAEDRKAYYACLELSEKIAQQYKQSDGTVRIVSLPYCKN